MDIVGVSAIYPDDFGIIRPDAKLRGTGTCYLCKNVTVIYFSAIPPENATTTTSDIVANFSHARRAGESLSVNGWLIEPVQTFPPLSPHRIPKSLPPGVRDCLQEAHDNASDKRWRSAVMGYATTLEFACIDLLGGEKATAPLGGKLRALKGKSQLPVALIDFIEVVNLDRRAATHYTEAVTEAACDAARVLTTTTLEYLYSLPAEIDAATERLENAVRNG